MIAVNSSPFVGNHDAIDESLFGLIAKDLENKGYSIRPGAVPNTIANALYAHQQSMSDQKYVEAGVGRGIDLVKNEFIRKDEICWINGESVAGQQWINWMAQLQRFLNQQLFLGLFSFESHFSHYAPGAFYKRHYDAFRGEANRVLSVVAYLNPGWSQADGGELVLYAGDEDREGLKVAPLFGTLAVFLSEEFPHEVLPTSKDRYAVAGWFRVNTSIFNAIDPPL